MIRLLEHGSPRVSLLILGFRDAPGLRRCLAALAANLPVTIPSETIVLANGASDEVLSVLRGEVTGVRVLHSPVNLGFARGCNRARAAAAGEYLVLLNDDAEVESGWLEALVQTADGDPHAGAIGGKMLDHAGRLAEAGQVIWRDGSTLGVGRGDPQNAYSYLRRVDYCSAAALLVRAEVWDAVGGMDEGYFPAYYEDVDLCLAIRALGYDVLYQPRARVRHDWKAFSGIDYSTFLQLRMRKRFCARWPDFLASCEPAQPDDPSAVERAVLRARGVPRRVLIVDDLLPTAVGSGFGRMLDSVDELVHDGYAVTFCPRFAVGEETTHLEDAGVEIVRPPLREHLAEPGRLYDVVIVSRPFAIEADLHAVRDLQPQASIFYDCEALAHRRLFRQAKYTADAKARAKLMADGQALESVELELPRRVDHVVCVTEEEAAVLRAIDGAAPVDVIATRSTAEPTREGFDARTGAVFVAGWLSGADGPNVDALHWFAEHVLPRVVEKLPSFRLLVTGPDPPEFVRTIASPNLVLVGYVADLRALYASARVAVAPVRYGSGVRIKTLEALLHGVPVVATTIGAEGCGLEARRLLEPLDDPTEFADRLTLMMTDRVTWEAAHAEVMEVLETRRLARQPSWSSLLTEAQMRRSSGRFALQARN